MVAVPLLFGRLTAADYEDEVAQDKRIDALREKIVCYEDPAFTADYHDPEKNVLSAMRSPWSLLMAHALTRLSWSIRLVMRVAAPTVFEAYRKFKINWRVSSRLASSNAFWMSPGQNPHGADAG